MYIYRYLQLLDVHLCRSCRDRRPVSLCRKFKYWQFFKCLNIKFIFKINMRFFFSYRKSVIPDTIPWNFKENITYMCLYTVLGSNMLPTCKKKEISHFLIYSQTHLFIKHFLVQLIVLDTDHSKSKLWRAFSLHSFFCHASHN